MSDEHGSRPASAPGAVAVAGQRFQAVPAAATGSGPSTGCPSRRRRHRCAARWCTPRWSSCTRCPPPSAVHDTALTLVDPALGSGGGRAARPGRRVRARAAGRAARRGARKLLSGYYRLEDPTRFDPQSCEQRVEVELADGTLLRGFVDRIDVAPDRRDAGGRLQDRQGAARRPRALAEFKAHVPDEVLCGGAAAVARRAARATAAALPGRRPGARLPPDLDELLRFEKTLMAIWRAIQSAGATGDFRPKPSRLCDWCAHHAALPGVRWHSAAVPRLAEAPEARATMTRCCNLGAGCVIDCHYRRLAGRRRLSGVRVDRRYRAATGIPKSSTAHRRWR